jgi:hypothetical protein
VLAPVSRAEDRHHDRHHRHHDDRHADSYTGAAFGRGLNTTQPQGNPLNNVILPKWIEVKAGGVVNFAHAGFHHIVIFKPGFRRDHLDPFIPATGTFILPSDPTVPLPPEFSGLADHVYYRGDQSCGRAARYPGHGQSVECLESRRTRGVSRARGLSRHLQCSTALARWDVRVREGEGQRLITQRNRRELPLPSVIA